MRRAYPPRSEADSPRDRSDIDEDGHWKFNILYVRLKKAKCMFIKLLEFDRMYCLGSLNRRVSPYFGKEER